MFRRRTPVSLQQRVREFVWPSMGWLRYARYIYLKTLRLSACPHKVAFGFACGAFMAVTPLIGFQIMIAGAIAIIGQGSVMAAALGTLVGNPATFPLFWVGSYQLGSALLGIDGSQTFSALDGASFGIWDSLTSWSFTPLQQGVDVLWPIFKPMLVGSLPLGLLVGALSYLIIYRAMRPGTLRWMLLHGAIERLVLPGWDHDNDYFPGGLPGYNTT